MIKIPFNEVKIDEILFSKNNSNQRLVKTKDRHVSEDICNVVGKDDECIAGYFLPEEEVYVSRFKDRFNKDLSIGDRVLVANGDEEFYPNPQLEEMVINSLRNMSGNPNHYIINSDDNNESIYNMNIVKIEKDWGI